MANPDLERFRLKLREYRLLVNRSQGDLAVYLNLDYGELSNRLNAHKNAHLSHDNVRAIIRALAEWSAITTQPQAEELLDLMLCPHFDQVDLQARPLSKLTISPIAVRSNKPTALDAVAQNPLLKDSLFPATNHTKQPFHPNPPHNLPHNLNLLLGREQELVQVAELLGQPQNRLVTLTGAGGSGKTSLAVEAGRKLLLAFSQGVYLVRLENVTRSENLLGEIAATFKVNETGGQDLLHNLKEYFKEKDLLLILDNFEQLIGEAEVLVELLRETNHLKLLVTSRIPLQLSFEQELPVGPLALPDKEALANQLPVQLGTNYPGIALFITRAKSVNPEFTLSQENIQPVVEICRRLDGLPLALELAAARVRTFSPQKLLERLSLKVLTGGGRDLPARQKTLWDTISWSYDLLTEEEQSLFARLAIFVGGCTLEAAEAVCSPQGELGLEVFEGLELLLTRNLLKKWQGLDGETRYGMLVTIREFGLEKLAQSCEVVELGQRYLTYYLTRSRHLTPEMSGANPQSILRLHDIESDYVNYRAVLYKALEEGKAEEALELSGAFGDYFEAWGYSSEGLGLLEQSLAIPYLINSPAFKALRAKVLWWAGGLHFNLGNIDKAYRYTEESLALQREVNSKREIIFSLNRLNWFTYLLDNNYAKSASYLEESLALSLELNEEEVLENTRSSLAMTAVRHGNYKDARCWFEENLVMCTKTGNKWGVGVALGGLGWVSFIQGQYEEAEHLLEESLALFRELAIKWGVAFLLSRLAAVALSQENNVRALAYSQESLAISREFGFVWGIALSFYNLGNIALCEGNYRQAHSFFEESLTLNRKMGDKLEVALVLLALGLNTANQGDLKEAQHYYVESILLSRELGNKLCIAHNLTGLAGLWIHNKVGQNQTYSTDLSNHFTRVARLSGAISGLLASCEAVMFRPLALLYAQNLAVVRATLDEATFETAFAEGQAMSMDEAVAYASANSES